MQLSIFFFDYSTFYMSFTFLHNFFLLIFTMSNIDEFTSLSAPCLLRSQSSKLAPAPSCSHYCLYSSTLPLLGDWPPYASYLTVEVARLKSLNESLVPSGLVGSLYVRAVYNDEDRIMDGCGDQLWCPYDSFRTEILKTGVSHSEYQKGCRNTQTQTQ